MIVVVEWFPSWRRLQQRQKMYWHNSTFYLFCRRRTVGKSEGLASKRLKMKTSFGGTAEQGVNLWVTFLWPGHVFRENHE